MVAAEVFNFCILFAVCLIGLFGHDLCWSLSELQQRCWKLREGSPIFWQIVLKKIKKFDVAGVLCSFDDPFPIYQTIYNPESSDPDGFGFRLIEEGKKKVFWQSRRIK